MTSDRDKRPVQGWGVAAPRPFEIAVPAAVLEDLNCRLARARWPDEIPGSGWNYGTDLSYLRDLTTFWRDHYQWREHEAALNRFHHFKVMINGIDLHFIHEVGEGSSPMPLLLTHGWPGSFFEYHKLIPMLTRPSEFGGDPEDAFSVVVPSIPGHGFSYSPGQPRLGLNAIADTFATLMTKVLGCDRFASHGHDWGAFISSRLGYAHARHLIGIHISLLAIPREMPQETQDPEVQRFRNQLGRWLREETGYSWMMGTKPQTLAYALTDSPIGLAAWILEKFRSWSDCGGDIDVHFTRDVLLTNVMLYWVSGAINTTFWPYYARLHEPWIVPPGEKVLVPTGYAEYPREILTPPRSLAEGMYGNIRRWTRMPTGGHFPALEAPEALADEIRAFFRPLRS